MEALLLQQLYTEVTNPYKKEVWDREQPSYFILFAPSNQISSSSHSLEVLFEMTIAFDWLLWATAPFLLHELW